MQEAKRFMRCSAAGFFAALALFLITGCHSAPPAQSQPPTKIMATLPETPAPAPAPAPAAPAMTAPAMPAAPAPAATASTPVPPVRIDAGASAPYKDADGNMWLADTGFADGETTDRPDDMQIANTKDPALYRTEHYSMTSFSYPVPNGKYVVKLHFAETYDEISGPGGRVFSFNVQGHDFKDFDVWVKAGGNQRACVETVNVEVTDGKLTITFTPQEENPEINGIEILPAP